MRIDPKHFNLFIAVCALFAAIVIIFSTFRYSQKQIREFESNIADVRFEEITFRAYSGTDSLALQNHFNKPVVIHFWSTWSGKSIEINAFLNQFIQEVPDVIIIAAAVRDAEEEIQKYIYNVDYDFHFVDGTEFYQSLLIPGLPSFIFLDRNGELFSTQIGDDKESLSVTLSQLLENE